MQKTNHPANSSSTEGHVYDRAEQKTILVFKMIMIMVMGQRLSDCGERKHIWEERRSDGRQEQETTSRSTASTNGNVRPWWAQDN